MVFDIVITGTVVVIVILSGLICFFNPAVLTAVRDAGVPKRQIIIQKHLFFSIQALSIVLLTLVVCLIATTGYVPNDVVLGGLVFQAAAGVAFCFTYDSNEYGVDTGVFFTHLGYLILTVGIAYYFD